MLLPGCQSKKAGCGEGSHGLQSLLLETLTMLDAIRKNLRKAPRDRSVAPQLTLAAVLMPLLHKDDELHVLLTKRTQTVKVHKGQISFPGGVRDPGDESLLATALREAKEEIGLGPDDVELLGSLEPVNTAVSGFLVHTFVGHIPYPYPFQLNSEEVAEILLVPYRFLADASHWYWRTLRSDQHAIQVYFIPYDRYLIWGATARILKLFFERNGVKMKIRPALG
jgi:8-oxo-dGTP pyrophosphatase MutT (NUDIX family)